MATKRISWKFFLGYGIKHVSESDVWSIYDMPGFEYVGFAHSLNDARKKIFRELPIKPGFCN